MIWILLFLGFYPYVVYPLLIWLIGRVMHKPVKRDKVIRSVTVVIAAHNEENCIAETVRNKLQQDYPIEALSIIVVSDGSEDRTDLIVQKIASQSNRVTYLRQEPRQGKTAALNAAVLKSKCEIIVFSDANSLYAPSAIRELVSCFADPTIGYVSGRLVYTTDSDLESDDGCSTYMRYENWLRRQETRLGSIVGVDGGIDAVRRELYQPMRVDHLPDFILPLRVVRAGYRIVYEPLALLREKALISDSDEIRMRVRVTARAFRALAENLGLLNPFRFGLFAWQLLSHKWMRYLSFIPLLAAFFLSIAQYDGSAPYVSLLALEATFIGFVALGLVSPKIADTFALVRWSKFFAVTNLASAIGLVKAISGERFVTWRPRSG